MEVIFLIIQLMESEIKGPTYDIYLEKALIKYQEILCGRRLKRNESKKYDLY
jgi:hypothetical protein